MAEPAEEQPAARPGRCVNHPTVAAFDVCAMCGLPICMACAVPVRGRIVGSECLGKVLVDAPMPARPAPFSARGDGLATAGFTLVLVASAFPWSKFGGSSHFFGAWANHWSLVAAVSGVAGLLLALVRRRRPIDDRISATAYALLGLGAAVASVIQHRHPPLLTEATWWPWIAAMGGLVAVFGAMAKARSVARANRRPWARRLGR